MKKEFSEVEEGITSILEEIHELEENKNARIEELKLEMHDLVIKLSYEEAYAFMQRTAKSQQEFCIMMGKIREAILHED